MVDDSINQYLDLEGTGLGVELDTYDLHQPLVNYLSEKKYDDTSKEVIIDYKYFEEHHAAMVWFFDNEPIRIIREVLNIIRNGKDRHVSVKITNYYKRVLNIRDIRNEDIGKLVNIDCVIRKVSDIKQEIVYAGMRCAICNTPIKLFEVDERMIKPTSAVCPINSAHTKTYLDPELCVYRDIQIITAQERQTEGGKQPKNITCIISSGVVDKLQAGNRVRLTGLIKVRIDKKNIASTFMEVVDVIRDDEDFSEVKLTQDDISKIVEFSDDNDIYKHFADSINPNIYGYDDVKLGLVLCMFGGVTRKFDDGTRIRGESHILLCGDPSTAKSQLIYSVSKIMPRVIYTSGKSTSAAGLTAAAIKDEVDGKWTLEAGALPLANGGVVVCDEFDKLSDDDRSALHEAMELGSISVNKAGLSEKLETETTLIAAANPKSGRFIRGTSLRDQLDLPPSLISRFDLIFTILDDIDSDKDVLVAKSVLSARRRATTTIDRTLDIDFMRKYITYAKSINPQMSEVAESYLIKTYKEIREDPNTYITVRQLDALIRLSEASARVRLRDVISMEDVRRAVHLFFSSMKSASLGNKIDVSLFDSRSSKDDIMNKEYVLMMVSDKEYDMKTLCDLLVLNRKIEYDEANNLLLEMIKDKMIKVVRIPEQNRSYVIKL